MRNRTLVALDESCTLGNDISLHVATATTHDGNFGVGISGRLRIAGCALPGKTLAGYYIALVRVLTAHIFSLPAALNGARNFHVGFPAGKVARRWG